MTLLLTAEDVEGLLDEHDAIEVTRNLVLDYVAGTTRQMSPFGGYGAAGQTPLPRVAAGVMFGRGRMCVRGGDTSMLFDLANRLTPIAIMALDVLDLRVAGNTGLAVTYLARPEAKTLAVVGSSHVARGAVIGTSAVRSLSEIRVYSTTPANREAFAAWAEARSGVRSSACETLAEATRDADIIAVATNARASVLSADNIRPGTLAIGLGSDHELDESVYLGATQLVATSRAQMLAAGGSGQSGQGSNLPRGPLARLRESGALRDEALVDLGAIVAGEVPARNGPTDVAVYLDARGGVADAALVSAIYDRARERGLGREYDFALRTSADAQRTAGVQR
jgi:alanine dehydrogenase